MKKICEYGMNCDKKMCLHNECGHCIVDELDVLFDWLWLCDWDQWNTDDDRYITNLRNRYDDGDYR